MATWEVRGFYNQLGIAPNQMVIHTWHTSEHSRDLEIQVLKERRDVGRIERRVAGGDWVPA
jgi:hypothetical protein